MTLYALATHQLKLAEHFLTEGKLKDALEAMINAKEMLDVAKQEKQRR